MTPEQIQQNKAQFLEICRAEIHRDGLDELLNYLENKSDFFTAPSSTKFHLNEPGGLCRHSLNVYETLITLYDNVYKPALEAGTSPFSEEVSRESMAIAALFHDLCKINIYATEIKHRKNALGRWEDYEGYVVKDNFPYGHGEKSCYRIGEYIKLKREELLAIRWHMGMFDICTSGTSQYYTFCDALGAHPLVSMLHVADMLASNLKEKTAE